MKFLKYIAETNLVAVVKFIFELIICLIVMSIVSIVTVITAIFVFPFIRKHTDNDAHIWWAWRLYFLKVINSLSLRSSKMFDAKKIGKLASASSTT